MQGGTKTSRRDGDVTTLPADEANSEGGGALINGVEGTGNRRPRKILTGFQRWLVVSRGCSRFRAGTMVLGGIGVVY